MKLKITDSKILTFPICIQTRSSVDKSSMKKSISKILLLFLNKMIVSLPRDKMTRIVKPVRDHQKNYRKLLQKIDLTVFTKKKRLDQNKKAFECSLRKPLK